MNRVAGPLEGRFDKRNLLCRRFSLCPKLQFFILQISKNDFFPSSKMWVMKRASSSDNNQWKSQNCEGAKKKDTETRKWQIRVIIIIFILFKLIIRSFDFFLISFCLFPLCFLFVLSLSVFSFSFFFLFVNVFLYQHLVFFSFFSRKKIFLIAHLPNVESESSESSESSGTFFLKKLARVNRESNLGIICQSLRSNEDWQSHTHARTFSLSCVFFSLFFYLSFFLPFFLSLVLLSFFLSFFHSFFLSFFLSYPVFLSLFLLPLFSLFPFSVSFFFQSIRLRFDFTTFLGKKRQEEKLTA